jgi:hypothetical protein
MNSRFGMSLFVSIAWVFVGGIITFWMSVDQTSWRIVGGLITVIGIVGINLAVAERNRTRASP